MFKSFRLRKRFMVILLLIFVLSLPLLAVSSYYVLKRNVDREVYENARVFLFTMESIRKHYGDVTRPAVSKELPDKFVVEAMSTSFNARGVAERVRKEFPQYIFKHASLNPRNPINKADKFEEGIISKFRANKTLKESNGFVKKESGEYFYVSRPVTTKEDCLRCHGAPTDAPMEVIDNYGNTAAFGWKNDEMVASLMAYVPSTIAVQNATKALILFVSFYGGIFFLLFILIDKAIVGSIIKPIEELAEVAEEISLGKFERNFIVKTKDEMKTLADAFTRMKLSLIKAFDMLKKK
jgi:HAMP domain-containing protein